jgi:hypothetical protein
MEFRDKEFRREFCMFAALAVGIAGLSISGISLSHNLGYWPYGSNPQSSNSKSTMPPRGGLMEWLMLAVSSGSILTVGILYYKASRREQQLRNPPKVGGQTEFKESESDKRRRQRVREYIDKMSVPQKFALRSLVRFGRVHHDQLVKFGVESGFGENIDGYIDRMANDSELIVVDRGDYMISGGYLDDSEKILSEWFKRIASASETL